MKPPFRTKICGVRSPEDARQVVAAGADAIGLNFYRGSSRYVEVDAAERIIEPVRGRIQVVGVFVNSPPDEIREIAERLELSAIQLHGDESPELVGRLADFPVVRALRCSDLGLDPVIQQAQGLAEAGVALAALLLDAFLPGHYGGTGQVADWSMIAQRREEFGPLPLILAGGLTPENVAQAIRTSGADAVDTASGVESEPGKKDTERVRQFVDRALEALPAS